MGFSVGLADLELLAEKLLDDELAQVDTTGVDVIAEAVPGPPAMAIVEASDGADLVVVGQRGLGGFSGLLLGSVSYQVVTHPLPGRDRARPVVAADSSGGRERAIGLW
jgi:nucleotide-binding universal stress UspA family protein